MDEANGRYRLTARGVDQRVVLGSQPSGRPHGAMAATWLASVQSGGKRGSQ